MFKFMSLFDCCDDSLRSEADAMFGVKDPVEMPETLGLWCLLDSSGPKLPKLTALFGPCKLDGGLPPLAVGCGIGEGDC